MKPIHAAATLNSDGQLALFDDGEYQIGLPEFVFRQPITIIPGHIDFKRVEEINIACFSSDAQWKPDDWLDYVDELIQMLTGDKQ